MADAQPVAEWRVVTDPAEVESIVREIMGSHPAEEWPSPAWDEIAPQSV